MNEKELLQKFLSSFGVDKRLVKYDVDNCIAWTELLAKNKVVDKNKAKKVVKTLQQIKHKLDKLLVSSEDVHFAVEQTLEKLLKKDKDLAGIIRTARSRNDLVVSDERMFLKEQMVELINLLKKLVSSIVEVAQKNIDLPMVGYTHLQPAQPVLFSHYVLSFAWWFVRDIDRLKDCYKRVDVSVLGSAAFAGSSFKINIKEFAKKLKFTKVVDNSVDAVSDRDFIVEFISCCAMVMMHLSRIAEEFIIWCSPNFGYISLPENLTSGSSIMPQKQNPDYLELIRGKTAKVYSDLLGILTLMKNLPLTYNRDMQEDKNYLFSAVDTTKDCVKVMTLIFKNLKLNNEKFVEDVKKYDFIFSTEFANFLVTHMGLSFKTAHKKVQDVLKYCRQNNKKLTELKFEELRPFLGKSFDTEAFNKLKEKIKENIADMYKTYAGSSLQQVRFQINKLKKIVK